MDETLQSFGYPEYEFNISKADYSYKDLEDFLIHKIPGAQTNPDSASQTAARLPLPCMSFPLSYTKHELIATNGTSSLRKV